MRPGIILLFGLTSFLASALLFTAEPMIGKMVLPMFGGTPAVWNTCLVYFQMILLMGYTLSVAGVGIGRDDEPHLLSPLYLLPMGMLLATACAVAPLRARSERRRPGQRPGRPPVLVARDLGDPAAARRRRDGAARPELVRLDRTSPGA